MGIGLLFETHFRKIFVNKNEAGAFVPVSFLNILDTS